MARRAALSKSEMEVARMVWNLGEATVRQVHEAFSAQRRPDFTTVQTYLRRLQAKGYLRARRQGRTLVYRARVEPDDVIRQTVGELVDRLFGGEAVPLVHHLIHDGRIDGEEIRKLRAMIDAWEARQDESERS
jgi:BlaI family transcriptional regulator, penicillinase repressor